MSPLVLGPLTLAALFLGWLLVQRLWRRVFNLDGGTDVLASRCDCAGCGYATTCQRRRRDTEHQHHLFTPQEQGHG